MDSSSSCKHQLLLLDNYFVADRQTQCPFYSEVSYLSALSLQSCPSFNSLSTAFLASSEITLAYQGIVSRNHAVTLLTEHRFKVVFQASFHLFLSLSCWDGVFQVWKLVLVWCTINSPTERLKSCVVLAIHSLHITVLHWPNFPFQTGLMMYLLFSCYTCSGGGIFFCCIIIVSKQILG